MKNNCEEEYNLSEKKRFRCPVNNTIEFKDDGIIYKIKFEINTQIMWACVFRNLKEIVVINNQNKENIDYLSKIFNYQGECIETIPFPSNDSILKDFISNDMSTITVIKMEENIDKNKIIEFLLQGNNYTKGYFSISVQYNITCSEYISFEEVNL